MTFDSDDPRTWGNRKPAATGGGMDPESERLHNIYSGWTGQLNGSRIKAPMSLLLASGTTKRCTASITNTLTRRSS